MVALSSRVRILHRALNWPILPERKSFQNQWLGKLRRGCPNTLLCCPNFSHRHILCEPGSVTWDLVFDEKFCPQFEGLNLTPQTQRLSITVQKVSINLCRYCVTEGNDKIFCRLLGLYLPSSSFFSCQVQTFIFPWPDWSDSLVPTNSSLTSSWVNIFLTWDLFPPLIFFSSIETRKRTHLFSFKQKDPLKMWWGREEMWRELFRFLRFGFDLLLNLGKSQHFRASVC